MPKSLCTTQPGQDRDWSADCLLSGLQKSAMWIAVGLSCSGSELEMVLVAASCLVMKSNVWHASIALQCARLGKVG